MRPRRNRWDLSAAHFLAISFKSAPESLILQLMFLPSSHGIHATVDHIVQCTDKH